MDVEWKSGLGSDSAQGTTSTGVALTPGVELAFTGVWVPVVEVRSEGDVIRACLAFGTSRLSGGRAGRACFRPEDPVRFRKQRR